MSILPEKVRINDESLREDNTLRDDFEPYPDEKVKEIKQIIKQVKQYRQYDDLDLLDVEYFALNASKGGVAHVNRQSLTKSAETVKPKGKTTIRSIIRAVNSRNN
jgi:hypothetical protein